VISQEPLENSSVFRLQTVPGGLARLIFVTTALGCGPLLGSIYDAYTTQYGYGYTYQQTVGFGVLSATADEPVEFYPASALASAGYHDSLVIFDGLFGKTFQTSGAAGVLDVSYFLGGNCICEDDPGGADLQISATGFPSIHFSVPNDHINFSETRVVSIPFQYNVPFSSDGYVQSLAGAGGGFAFLSVNSLTVETTASFLWSDASGTLYNFTNGQFTETPEPSTWMLAVFVAAIFLTVHKRYRMKCNLITSNRSDIACTPGS
jgi:hypothetical protein